MNNNQINAQQTQGIASPKRSWMQKLEQVTGKPIERARVAYLLIDCSGSMEGGKIEAARSGALGFCTDALAKGYAVGVIVFETTARCCLDASRDIAAIRAALSELAATGSTNLTAGIDCAILKLTGVTGDLAMCIVTDGAPDSRESALRAAQRAKDMRIEILTIGTDDADQSFLDQLASRKELSVKVEPKCLGQAISDMARLLPGK